MSLFIKAHGINTFLAETYDPTIMLVDVLVRSGFDEQQSRALYANHAEALLSAYVDAIRFRLVTARQDSERLFHILTRRYSF